MPEEAFKEVLEKFNEILKGFEKLLEYKLEGLGGVTSRYCRELETKHEYELCIKVTLRKKSLKRKEEYEGER